MITKQEKALRYYDGDKKERMKRVINAIAGGRLIYMRFFEDGSGASFYFRDTHDVSGNPWYFLYNFNTEDTNIILMGCCIDKTSFGL